MITKRRGAATWATSLVGVFAATVTLAIAAILPSQKEVGAPEATSKDDIEVDTPDDAAEMSVHRVTILGRRHAPGIPTGEFDRLGNPVLANCTTCHATREANRATHDGAQLKDFHQGLATAHGELACVACHNPNDYSQLRLASGEGVEFADSLQLCAQCHGTQFRDYQNGAHGGMTGHWDLAAGPRVRNHCLACHDAHAPQYQQVMPVFAPCGIHDGQTTSGGHP